MARSVRARVYRHAAAAWERGRPHEALEILAEAGLQHQWSLFVRVAHHRARRRFVRRMARP